MNDHWLDKNGKHGMSDYFWKYKHDVLMEATGHTEEEIKAKRKELGVETN